MALTSKITPYDATWPARFLADKPLIASAFGDELIAIQHVGSTSVPGLAAKPAIDVLIEVHDHSNASARDEVLLGLGYVRGSDLSEGIISIGIMWMGFARTSSTLVSVATLRSPRWWGSEICLDAMPRCASSMKR